MHYDPKTASKIINACVILHNICVNYKIPMPNEEFLDLGNERVNREPYNEPLNAQLLAGRRARYNLLRYMIRRRNRRPNRRRREM